MISRLTGSRVSGSDFDLARVPGHLRPTFDVIGDRGRVVASGKDLAELQDRLRSRARESVVRVAEARTPNAIERAVSPPGTSTSSPGSSTPSRKARAGA